MASVSVAAKRAQWEARAICLASEHHLTGCARHIGRADKSGAHLYEVPSWTHDGCYVVRVWPTTGDLLCSCMAGTYGKPCGHSGAVLLAERQRVQAETSAGQSEAWRYWLNGGSGDGSGRTD
jgi:hypothetical protein